MSTPPDKKINTSKPDLKTPKPLPDLRTFRLTTINHYYLSTPRR